MFSKKMKMVHYFNISKICFVFVMTNVITFRSRRRGFQRYIVGQLKECGSQFYHEEIYVRIQEDLSTNECE